MTTVAKIGPIDLSQAHEIVDPESDPGKFQISIKCTPEEAKQLVGLCQPLARSESGAPRIIYSRENRWGLLPINSPVESVVPSLNSYTGLLRGLGALSNPMEYFINTKKSKVVMDGVMLSENFYEILTVLYSRGGEDGTDIEHDYDDLTPAYIINESGADFDTTNDWFPIGKWYMDNGVISSDGTQITFTGGANVDGNAGHIWTNHRTQFSHNFTMEFTLLPGTKPSAGNGEKDINVWFSPWKPTTPPVWADSFLISLGVNSTNQFYQVNSIGGSGGLSWVNLVPATVDNTATAFKFRLSTDNKYYMKVELNRYVSGAWTGYTQIYYGPTNIGGWEDLYMGIYYLNRDSTSNSMSIKDISVYKYLEVDLPNTVWAPPGAVLYPTADFTRPSADGNINYWLDPTGKRTFQVTPANFYKGSVLAYSSNFDDSVARLVTHNEVDLDPLLFNVSNGLVKLVTGEDSVTFQAWTGEWTTMETFTLPTDILLMRPFHVSPNSFTLQLDRTFWTLHAGKPGIEIEHPYTDIGYTLHTCYEHDGATTTSPAADADIPMLTNFHTKIWDKGTGTCTTPNPAQRYRLMILQQYKTTIKSDSIPANNGKTGIVFYDSNIADDAEDGSLFRAREWFRPTRRGLALQGV
jgi:hypothetical protein